MYVCVSLTTWYDLNVYNVQKIYLILVVYYFYVYVIYMYSCSGILQPAHPYLGASYNCRKNNFEVFSHLVQAFGTVIRSTFRLSCVVGSFSKAN